MRRKPDTLDLFLPHAPCLAPWAFRVRRRDEGNEPFGLPQDREPAERQIGVFRQPKLDVMRYLVEGFGLSGSRYLRSALVHRVQFGNEAIFLLMSKAAHKGFRRGVHDYIAGNPPRTPLGGKGPFPEGHCLASQEFNKPKYRDGGAGNADQQKIIAEETIDQDGHG